MAYRPVLSTQTTAGSEYFDCRQGAMVRTHIPRAPTKTNASNELNESATNDDSEPTVVTQSADVVLAMTASPSSSAMRRAVGSPAWEMRMMAVLKVVIG